MTATDRNGRIERDGETAALVFERRLPYRPEAVWAALTDPAQRAFWLGRTTMDARVGGEIDMAPTGPMVPPEMSRMTGKIRVWDPPRVFEHEWHQKIIGPTVVRYELKADGAGTVLTLRHSGLTPKNAEGFIPGTHAYLDRLEAQLANEPLPDWMKRFGEVAPSYGFKPSWG